MQTLAKFKALLSVLCILTILATVTSIASTSSGHWLQKNVDGGTYLILEDNTMWQVDPFDKFEAAFWLPMTNITIIDSMGGSPGYDYILQNTDDGKKVHAKLMR